MNITLKELITSFTKSIDLYNYLLKNHHRRTAIAAYHIGVQMGLSGERLSDLTIAASLHDIGALTISERDSLIQMDVENPFPHSSLGSYMLSSFSPFQKISRIIFYHHWHYDLDNTYIPELGPVPLEAYILHVADRTDILVQPDCSILAQKQKIIKKMKSYCGTVFHPAVIDAYLAQAQKDSFWLDIDNWEMETILKLGICKRYEIDLTMDLLEEFALTLSKIIDSRSKFAISHSFGVSQVAYAIAERMDYSQEDCRKIRVAGLLHDMGKIAVATEIIEKKEKLSEIERADIRTHAYFTYLILGHISGLEGIVEWASGHHENHDGSGYPMNLVNAGISQEMDIVSYADIFTALSEDRPYRQGMTTDQIIQILQDEFLTKHGEPVFQVILNNLDEIEKICKASVQDGIARFHSYLKLAKAQEQSIKGRVNR
ncbi:MAG: HD domain-containing protein [Acetobacterium sp.]|nr:HD domain-containing protein [Bacillota bacterium]MCG2731167.1 HD domain-containing protein [Acetobacterium sp.]